MKLFFRKYGTGYPLVILHGLYGSSDNWVSIARALENSFSVWLLDARNHGRSPHNEHHNYPEMAQDVYEFFIEHKIEKAAVIGHSMGGKTAMYFADSYSPYISHLLILDIAPKAYSDSTNNFRFQINHKKILETIQSINLNAFNKREDIENQLLKYLDDITITRFLMKNIKRNHSMKFEWLMNVEALLNNITNISVGFMPSQNKNRDKIPVLFVRGEKSDYINQTDIEEIKRLYTNVSIKTIKGAGHWLHVDAPLELTGIIKEFLTFSII
ncbi:MAG: alpha/beta fold hydrolase [Bacteroidales bacterium]